MARLGFSYYELLQIPNFLCFRLACEARKLKAMNRAMSALEPMAVANGSGIPLPLTSAARLLSLQANLANEKSEIAMPLYATTV